MKVDSKVLEKIAARIEGALKDTSVKNQSSIAFVVKGRIASANMLEPTEFTLAFTGDGNAENTFLPVWEGDPLNYTVLKVMHHGSKHNSFWNIDGTKVKNRYDQVKNNAKFKKACWPGNDLWDNKVPETCKGTQANTTLFFTNVTAKKYIISSSISEGHQNPHLSTLVGIITRAIVRYEIGGIDIFLTSQSIENQIHEFCLNFCYADPEDPAGYQYTGKFDANKKPSLFWDEEGKYYRIWQLKPEIDPQFGTIMVSPNETMPVGYGSHPMWERVRPTSIFYLNFHRRNFNTPTSLTVVPDTRLKKRQAPTVDAGGVAGVISKILANGKKDKEDETSNATKNRKELKKSKIEQKLANKRRAKRDSSSPPPSSQGRTGGDQSGQGNQRRRSRIRTGTHSGGSTNSSIANTQATAPMVFLSRQTFSSVVQPEVQFDERISKTVSVKKSQPSDEELLMPYETLARFDVKISPLLTKRLQQLQGYKFKKLADTVSFLHHMALSGSLTALQAKVLMDEHTVDDKLTLGGLLGLVFEPDLASKFIDLLPMTFAYPIPSDPFCWPLKGEVHAQVADYKETGKYAAGNTGVQSISFQVMPPAGGMEWEVPFQSTDNLHSPLTVQIIGHISFNIHWPFNTRRRHVYGSFAGQISSGGNISHVVVDYLYFPEEEAPVSYHIRFADEMYNVSGHSVKLSDIWSVMPLGLTSLVDEQLSLEDCGFAVARSSMMASTVDLKRIFGRFVFKRQDSWKPFGDLISIKLPTIGLRIENLFSVTPIRTFVRIEENLDIDGIVVPIVFETKRNRGTSGTIYQLSYISRPAEGLPLKKLIRWLSFGHLDLSGIPGLSKLLGTVKISNFSLGWFGNPEEGKQAAFSAKPDFVEVAIEMDTMDIVPNVLTVQEAWLEMRIDLASSGSGFNISAGITATLTIGDCDVEFLVVYGERPEWRTLDDEIPGHLKLALTSSVKPLSLANILGHFMPKQRLLPEAFYTILTNSGITKFQLGVEKNELKNNRISVFLVEVALEVKDVDIFDGFSISDPTFSLQVEYPNDVAKRRITSTIGAMTKIAGVEMKATIWLDIEDETTVGFTVMPVADRLPLGTLIKFLGEKATRAINLDLPEGFSSFTNFDCGPIYLSFSKKSGERFKLATFYFEIQSTTGYTLWDYPTVSLSDIGLMVNYVRDVQTTSAFGVVLDIAGTKLSGHLTYLSEADNLLNNGNQSTAMTTTGKTGDLKVWTATVGFEGEISLHSVLSSLIGVDVPKFFDEVRLDYLKKLTDIKITEVEMALSKSTEASKVKLRAQIECLAFDSVELVASKTTSWGFTLSLTCKDGPLKLLPDVCANAVKEYVTFLDTSIHLFYGAIDISSQRQGLILNQEAMTNLKSSGGIMIATSMKFDMSKAELLAKWFKKTELQVFGAAGYGYFVLGVLIPGELELLDGKLKVSASFLLSYSQNKFFIGASGDFKLQLDAISKDLIVGSVTVGITLPKFGLSFTFITTTRLRNVFKIQGFDLEALGISLELLPASGLTPTLFSLAGGAKLEGFDNVAGSIAFQFDVTDPTNCYLSGNLENLNLEALLTKFAADIQRPTEITTFLGKNDVDFKKLNIELALKKTKDITGTRDIKPGFHFEGALSIIAFGKPVWAGYTLIDVRPPSFVVIALMEPVVPYPSNPGVFSLKRWNDNTKPAYKLELPNVDPAYLTPAMLNDGPVLKVAVGDGDSNPVLISFSLVFMGSDPQYLSIRVNDDSFFTEFQFGDSSLSQVKAKVTCAFNSNIAITATLSLRIPAVVLKFACQLTSVFVFPAGDLAKDSQSPVGLNGDLELYAGWGSGKVGFSVTLWASATAFNKTWKLGHIGKHIPEEDLRSIAALISRMAKVLHDNFSRVLNEWVQSAQTVMEDAIRFVKNTWDTTYVEIVRVMVSLRDVGLPTALLGTVGAFNLPLKEAIDLFKEFGLNTWEALKFLGRKIGDLFSFQVALDEDGKMIGEPPKPPLFEEPVMEGLQQINRAMMTARSDEDVFLVSKQPLPDWYVEEMLGRDEIADVPELDVDTGEESEVWSEGEEETTEKQTEAEHAKTRQERAVELREESAKFTKEEVLAIAECLLKAGYRKDEIEDMVREEFGLEENAVQSVMVV
ncbi:uncharacterized protein BDZ99DRAFT_571890 [Mytilinidion resinicola]|uniref:Uncharacterized protein n=1 Tax=Mytilinidion resinicola TaxID=574789 RepID=A0A6A6YJS2_9PEZI|nr:uncharacterized protein BDZ99DRAFT_571890 [Mytilinidion resinicola]KAF2809061.1 hypothetical protein BDZ99DRAFT_571890 [Mytilinidion resinicola]